MRSTARSGGTQSASARRDLEDGGRRSACGAPDGTQHVSMKSSASPNHAHYSLLDIHALYNTKHPVLWFGEGMKTYINHLNNVIDWILCRISGSHDGITSTYNHHQIYVIDLRIYRAVNTLC